MRSVRRWSWGSLALALALAGCGGVDDGGAVVTDGGPTTGSDGGTSFDGGSPQPPPSPPPDKRPPQVPEGWTIGWRDEFDGSALDLTKWNTYTGAERTTASSSRAVSVANGLLTVTTFTESGQHYGELLTTQGKFETLYGYFEARVRFADSPGQWCAFWLQSPTYGNPIGDPGTAGAEIDVVEHRAHDWDDSDITNEYQLTLNWDGYQAPYHKILARIVAPPPGAPSLQGNFHTYGVLWTDAGYTFYLDDAPVFTASQGISHRTEYIFLSCEVQDKFWAGTIPTGGYGSLATSQTKMDVDYVRVWKAP